MRDRLIFSALMFGICSTSSLLAQDVEGVIRGPMLGKVAQTQVTISWQTQKAQGGAVHYGPTKKCALIQPAAGSAKRQSVLLSKLEAGTTYYYHVQLGGRQASRVYQFKTAPARKGSFSFALLGDSGTGSRIQYMIGRAILAAKPDLVIHGGDLVYPKGADKDYDRAVFLPYRRLLAGTPFFPCLGNHDYATQRGQPYLDNLVLPANNPKGTERYYSFDYAGSRFLCLDSNMFGADFTLSGQRGWIEQQLAQKSWGGWTFAFFHHPLYSVKKSRMNRALARRGKIVPYLERGKVDLTLTGHDHYYHRTHPVSYTRRWTMVHVTSGGGGAGLYRGVAQTFSGAFKSVHHYVWFEVESHATLRIEARAVDAKTGEVTVIEKVKLTRTQNGVRVW